MEETKIKRVQCSKCHDEIEDTIKTKFKLPFGSAWKMFRLCPKCQPSYFDIIEKMRTEKEKKIEEYLYAAVV